MLFDVAVGRIHSAVISGVNLEANSITVEWFEKNEIKGKEVCISFIALFHNYVMQIVSDDKCNLYV